MEKATIRDPEGLSNDPSHIRSCLLVFAANMSVKQKNHEQEYPLAASAVHKAFYMDDGLSGADSLEEVIKIQEQLQRLFARGGFLLRKWKSSEPAALRHLPTHLLDPQPSQPISGSDRFAKAPGIEWSISLDCFRLTVAKLQHFKTVTKRTLISDVANTFDVVGWFAPSIVKVKILLQRLWGAKVGWDDPVPPSLESPGGGGEWNSLHSQASSLHVVTSQRMSTPLRCNSMGLVALLKPLTPLSSTFAWFIRAKWFMYRRVRNIRHGREPIT